LATLAKDVRLTLGAGCQKDYKTANGSAELSENLKTPVATDKNASRHRQEKLHPPRN